MKNSNFKNIYLGAAVVIILNFSNCGKYDDGPNFSLKSKTSRLVGEWEIVKIDNDSPEIDLTLEFDKDGDFKFTYSYDYYGTPYTYSYKGDWEWSSDKETIEVSFDSDSYDWNVNRLTDDELWFTDDDDDTDFECDKVK